MGKGNVIEVGMNDIADNLENRRAAATIATSLSGYVIAGSLAIIGAEAAVFVFLLDGKQVSVGLGVALTMTFLVLFGSCYLGGLGVWKIYSDGFSGTWNIAVGNKFAWQLVLAIVGIVLLFVTSLLANSAREKLKDDPANRGRQRLAEQLAAADSNLSNRMGQIERELDDLKTKCQAEKCSVGDSDHSKGRKKDREMEK
jgi:hypothetical protein